MRLYTHINVCVCVSECAISPRTMKSFIMKRTPSYNIRKMSKNSFIQNLPTKINVLEPSEQRHTYMSQMYTDVKFT